MDIALLAIGTANPPFTRTQEDTLEFLATGFHLSPVEKRLLKSVYKATGIKSRYSVLSDYAKAPGEFEFFPNSVEANFPSTRERMQIYKKQALPLALKAVENCLNKLDGFDKGTITHLITVSCTGMYAPGIDIELVEHLNLDSTTKRTCINFMGCYGAFNGLKVAESTCKAEPEAKVLLVCVELCTLHFQRKMDKDNMLANAIFADGAAAVLLQAQPGAQIGLSIEKFYCDILPQTTQEMAWEIADSGFDIVLSSYVPQAIETGIGTFLNKFLEQTQLKPRDLDYFAIHPGGIKILQACEQALGLTPEQNKWAYQVLRDYGNMSSATILFVLEALWKDLGKMDHEKNIFCCAFGPGLTLESMILKVQAHAPASA